MVWLIWENIYVIYHKKVVIAVASEMAVSQAHRHGVSSSAWVQGQVLIYMYTSLGKQNTVGNWEKNAETVFYWSHWGG